MGISVTAMLRGARALAPAGALLLLAACSSGGLDASIGAFAESVYASVVDNGITVPAVEVGTEGLNPQFARREVPTPEFIPNQPGTIVVDTPHRYLYLVEADGKSMRYGIGVGREGFAWAGTAVIKAKQAWPRWIPPPEMVKRDPTAAPYAISGMPGGLDNPLGARALYLYVGNQDTLYRLHGTQEAWSIGQAVSSGCVRLLDQDVIDLYDRVPLGTTVVVIGDPDLMKARPAEPPVADALFPATPPVPPQPVGPA